MEIVCGNCGPINKHKKSCPLSVCPNCRKLEEREIKRLDKQAKENLRIDNRLALLEKVAEAGEEILANGYDQGRRITLRAALRALKEGR